MNNKKTITIIATIASVVGLIISVYNIIPEIMPSDFLKGLTGVGLGIIVSLLVNVIFSHFYKKKVHTIFLAYSSEQLELAKTITKYLEKDNFDIKVDFQDISIGDDIYVELNKEISNSEAVVFLLSTHLSNSKYLKKELDIASRNNKKLIPILTEENVKIPNKLKSISYFELFNTTETNLDRLKSQLQSVLN